MMTTCKIAVTDESQVGTVRRTIQEVCRRCGMDETQSGRASIVVTELARNLVRHAGGGEMLYREIPQGAESHLEFFAIDRGPGIKNIGEALRDGYSTIGTAGTGLGAVKRMADRFEIYSQPAKGTIIWTRLGAPLEKDYEIGGISLALESEELCGDAWDILREKSGLRVIVADGLGHGAFAEEAAREALTVFRKAVEATPCQALERIHVALGKTRGAAGAIAELSPTAREITSAGVGNIAMRLVGHSGTKSLVSENGTLGGSVRRVQQFKQPWPEENLLILHSDGLSAQWTLEDYPGLVNRHPSLIAAALYRDYRRERDDATVVAIRHKP